MKAAMRIKKMRWIKLILLQATMKWVGLILLQAVIGTILFLGGHYFYGNLLGTLVVCFASFALMNVWADMRRWRP